MLNAVITIAYRDFIKFVRDPRRVIATFIFPIVFIGILGNSLQSNLGQTVPYDFIAFTFTGVLGQILFQTSASGIISLVQDRAEDFAQELFITPIKRYVIILGKIAGEALVGMTQGIGIIVFGLVMGITFSWLQLLFLIPIFLVTSLLGAAFGVIVMSNLNNQKAANQIFPFVLLPQFFLAGVFAPINELPPALLVLSRIAPMTYAVDFTRNLFFQGTEFYEAITLHSPLVNLVVIGFMFVLFLGVGTWSFIRNERNK